MYIINTFFWYKAIFMTELILAEFIFCFRLKRKNKFWVRLLISLIICYGIAFGFPTPVYNWWYCSFIFLCLFATTIFCLKFLFKESDKNIVFVSIASYTTQHISYEIYTLFLYIFNISSSDEGIYSQNSSSFFPNFYAGLTYFIVIPLTYWLIYYVFGRRIKRNEEMKLHNFSILILTALVLLIDIFFTSAITYYSYDHFDRFYMCFVSVFNIVSCILALLIQFELSLRRKLQEEVVTIKQLREKEKEQYYISKENIDMINMKCHDLKHQIREIGNRSSLNQNAISDIENVISIYDSTVKTNNEVLDVILTEKSLLCQKKNISLSCIADGKKMMFMREDDLYSLIGNALDNAIEAVSNIEEDKRVIGITIKAKNDFLSINVHNYYEGKLTFINEMPITTKSNKKYHGYGTKSIRYIVHKYNGDCSFTAKNHIFNLNILFNLHNLENDEANLT